MTWSFTATNVTPDEIKGLTETPYNDTAEQRAHVDYVKDALVQAAVVLEGDRFNLTASGATDGASPGLSLSINRSAVVQAPVPPEPVPEPQPDQVPPVESEATPDVQPAPEQTGDPQPVAVPETPADAPVEPSPSGDTADATASEGLAVE